MENRNEVLKAVGVLVTVDSGRGGGYEEERVLKFVFSF
jgi:hypothetical protein